MTVLVLYLPVSSHANSSTFSSTLKILPLGDSITCASKDKLSYRYPLWKHLVDAGKQVEFIGSQVHRGNGHRSWEAYKGQPFPSGNEGHSGWRADQILNGLDTGEQGLKRWIKDYRPDIALIHLGTNDIHQSQSPESTRDEIEQIIAVLRARNTRIKVLIAKIIPMQRNHNVARLNQLLAKLAIKLNTSSSRIISVDMYSGFSIHNHMGVDQIHPNAKGEEVMAKRWFNALVRSRIIP